MAVRITAVLVTIVLIGVAILMFTGDIEVRCEDTFLRIEATYWADIEIDYAEIDSLAYRDDFDTGAHEWIWFAKAVNGNLSKR